jgi:hypothetical protein
MLPTAINRKPKIDENQKKKPTRSMAERLYGSSSTSRKHY